MGNPLLNPKNDYIFQRLFAGAPELLADLINAIRSDEAPIASLQVLNPRVEPNELHGEFIVLDILARDSKGRRHDIQMQVRRHARGNLRGAYYLARALAEQPVESGESCLDLEETVMAIHLLDFDLFEDAQAHWHFEVGDRQGPKATPAEMSWLHLIELGKADRQRTAQPSPLADWIAWLEHWQEEGIVNRIQHPPVQQAHEQLQRLSADDEAQRLAVVRERTLHDEIEELSAARRERLEDSRQQLATTVGRQLTRSFGRLSRATRAQLAAANIEQLETWAENLLDARTLDEVFRESAQD